MPPRTAPANAPRRQWWPLVILACYLPMAVGYSLATRLRWGPDEPGHVAYIESLALDARFPQLGEEDIYVPGAAISHQVQHPPLYYLLGAGVYRLALPLAPDGRVRALRLLSAMTGLAALWLLWRIAGLVFANADDRRPAAVAVFAALPLFGYMSGVVNNDALVVALALAALYATLSVMAGADRPSRYAIAGVLAGLAIATKEVALALLPVMVVGLLLPRDEAGPPLRRRVALTALALAPALVIPAPWWVRNVMLVGQPNVYAYVMPPFRGLGDALAQPWLVAQVLVIWAQRTFLTLWAPHWAIKSIIPAGPYAGAALAFAMGAVLGLMLLWLDHFRGRNRMLRLQAQSLGLMVMLAALVALGIIRYTLFVDYRAVEGGRYMLLAWPCLAVLAVAGWAHLAGPARRAVLATLLALWLAGDGIVLWAVGRTYDRW